MEMSPMVVLLDLSSFGHGWPRSMSVCLGPLFSGSGRLWPGWSSVDWQPLLSTCISPLWGAPGFHPGPSPLSIVDASPGFNYNSA